MSNIWIAAGEGNVAAVEEFLRADGADANQKDQNGYTALHAAASYSHVDLIRLLISTYKADPNIVDADGDAPLHVAETREVAELLVELGADPVLKNQEGLRVGFYGWGRTGEERPIDTADAEEHAEVVAYLQTFTPDFVPTQPQPDEDLSYLDVDAGETAGLSAEDIAELIRGEVDRLAGNAMVAASGLEEVRAESDASAGGSGSEPAPER
ncbi:ankyrin repeat-containing domain protein [Blyttiomyces helicus]|uniref:Ankyrin repeat-containing domain protein n=1 Tax=Blyttiomyces helicus TaxID=388810 RepID=A0A4P9WHK3_9FUNG|nr:ankyrin repeat-containing domain protein [Blyttiomyces helicus]|eukprot:RKO92214.1 ankyrin repeat-containing domain protein [Blyttiomyces helicus]